MKKILLIGFLLISICFNGLTLQVTDYDIAKSSLNKSKYEINNTMDSLGIWYKSHRVNVFPDEYQFVYSIENSEGSIKVYSFKSTKYSEGMIEYVTINYRHDDRKQVESLMDLKNTWKIRVGKYSTDVVYKSE